jgi:hypothetical protein
MSNRRFSIFLEISRRVPYPTVPAIDGNVSLYRRSSCGQAVINLTQEKVDVLWLSQKVFISGLDFHIDFSPICEYGVGLLEKKSKVKTGYAAYMLSSFDGADSEEHSPLLLEFLRHAAVPLHAHYFSRICLSRTSPQHCPTGCIIGFLSILAPDAHVLPLAETCWTIFEVPGDFLRNDDLRTIFDHHFHPAVKLSVNWPDAERDSSNSITLNDFLSLLAGSEHLRAADVPSELVMQEDDDSEENCLHFKEIVFKAPRIAIFYGHDTVSFDILHSCVASHHKITGLQLVLSKNFWSDEQDPVKLESFIRPLLRSGTGSSLERFSLVFFRNEWWFELITRWISSELPTCSSCKLIFLNVALGIDCGNEKHSETRNIDRVRRWDYVLFPQLVLNYARRKLPPWSPGGAVALSVKAINEGTVYQNTTDHVPFDMSTANAGLIFLILKVEFRAVTRLGRKLCCDRHIP